MRGGEWGRSRRDREPMSRHWFHASTNSRADHPIGVGRVRRKASALEVKSRNWENIKTSIGPCKNSCKSGEKKQSLALELTLEKTKRGTLAPILG